MRRQLAVLALAPLLLAGCSSGHSAPAAAAAKVAPDTIIIKNFMYSPMSLTVSPGSTITVTNEDTTTHTLSSSATPPVFNTGDIAPGKTTTFTAPTTPGNYTYICDIHQYMTGTLTVK